MSLFFKFSSFYNVYIYRPYLRIYGHYPIWCGLTNPIDIPKLSDDVFSSFDGHPKYYIIIILFNLVCVYHNLFIFVDYSLYISVIIIYCTHRFESIQ